MPLVQAPPRETIKARWAALKACGRLDSVRVRAWDNVSRVLSSSSIFTRGLSQMQGGLRDEMRPDPQCRCDRLTKLLLAMLHWRLTVAPYASNRRKQVCLGLHVFSRMFHRSWWWPTMGLVNVHCVVIEWWPWSEAVIDYEKIWDFWHGYGLKHRSYMYVLYVAVVKGVVWDMCMSV